MPVRRRTVAAAAALFAGMTAGLLLAPRSAHALPKYSQAEGKPCIYCHTGNVGNANNLNYRAKFYKANNLSFKGFDDAGEAKKAGVDVAPEATPPPKSYTPGEAPPPTPAQGNPPGEPAMPPQVMRTPPNTLTIAQATAMYKSLEKQYLKKPKDATLKRKMAEAHAQMGQSVMFDPNLPPMRKYPAALNHFRQALKMDPKNRTALRYKKEIEDVYKGMGRPVPGA
jgi:tetratricopeptide (TPR) repeat protein